MLLYTQYLKKNITSFIHELDKDRTRTLFPCMHKLGIVRKALGDLLTPMLNYRNWQVIRKENCNQVTAQRNQKDIPVSKK